MIRIVNGDLLQATETIIAHQVNCFGVAGGLAAAVFKKWPEAENDYNQILDRIQRIGVQGYALLGKSQITGQTKDGHIIANLYGQFYPGEDYRPKCLEKAMAELAQQAKFLKASVAMPYKISCGICGGDWDEVYEIIKRTMENVDVTLYRK